ncbi:MAG TPA: superoxide dismutase family protein [Candidatus Aquabacterium excrementipullorum]|nr:superoxide dismutase family protein [Candidatus Aquabacterium excrementipullorum]
MLAAAAAVAATLGCANRPGVESRPIALSTDRGQDAGSPVLAAASLTPTQGKDVRGLVLFREMDADHVMVHARVFGLKPHGEHGFHLHENGQCASPDGSSAGGHFNPGKTAHGPQHTEHHAGDMPSLQADANGVADQKFILTGVSLSPGPHSIDTRSVVVHADPDDFKTQPSGNAGARLACGVVAIQ